MLNERPRRFRLDAARGVEGVQTRTVGRDLELRQLQDRFQDVAEDGRWRVITIVGDAGVGKSRLLGELRSLAGRDARVGVVVPRAGVPVRRRTDRTPCSAT